MTEIARTFIVELTDEECSIITDALHNHFKAAKQDKNSNLINKIRDLRNGFAAFENRYFMGEDA